MKPCKACGSTRVEREVVPALAGPHREQVNVTCGGCGNRRSSYTRASQALRARRAQRSIGL